MNPKDSRRLMTELLNKDRFQYIEMIVNSKEGIGSREIAEKILESRGITEEIEIVNENVVVNKRLRSLVKLGILISDEGKYELTSLGRLLLDSWHEIAEKMDTMNRFGNFFDNHLVDDIPKEFFRQIYKLKNAKLTENPLQWIQVLEGQMENMETKSYNMTQYLHTFPDKVIEKKKSGEIDIVIIYQFENYPQLNHFDEKPLFDKLVEAGAEFRFIKLENRYPIGIRVVDDKWANFLLPRVSEKELDRDHVFYGNDADFVSWCRDLMYHIWSFEAKPLNTENVIAKRKE